jgi:Ca2+-transporting ATPase
MTTSNGHHTVTIAAGQNDNNNHNNNEDDDNLPPSNNNRRDDDDKDNDQQIDPDDPFDITQTKNASHETLRRWRVIFYFCYYYELMKYDYESHFLPKFSCIH